MKKLNLQFLKKRLAIFVTLFFCLVTMLAGSFTFVAQAATINVTDGVVTDWKGLPAFNDNFGDTLGVGPNDLTKLYVTSDATNIYARWDVILSGTRPKITSAAYSIALTSLATTGTTRPAVEARAYVEFNAQGAVASVAIENATKKISLPITYAQQVGSGLAKSLVSVEVKFPFADFNNNAMTVNPLTSNSIVPLWGEALSAGAFRSNVKDTVPDAGYLSYNTATGVSIPKGTGPVGNITASTTNPLVAPGGTVNFSLTIKNVGDATGNPNLLFNSVSWLLPTGFTYASGSTTGLVTANPTGTTGTLNWTVSGSLAPGASTTINFKATASGTAGQYYSDAMLLAQTPNVTYDTGDSVLNEVDAKYAIPSTPLNLTASSTTQTTTNLSWSASTGVTTLVYDIYDNGVEIVSNLTSTTYQMTGLTPGSTHYYTIKAKTTWGIESLDSNTATITTVAPYTTTVTSLLTKNNKPTITGTTTAPNGSTISLLINGSTYTGTVNNGTWSVAVTAALADNAYPVTATVLNATGNTATGTVTVDTLAPTISVNNINTQNTKPTITGTTNAANGSTVTLTINGQQYTGTVSNGSWSIAVTAVLADNAYPVSASVSDAAGNIGTGSGTAIIDTVAPTVSVNSITTTKIKPTITGTTNAADGSTVTLIINGEQYTGVASSGSWSIVVNMALTDGIYPMSASVSDPAGNIGTGSGTVTVNTGETVVKLSKTSSNLAVNIKNWESNHSYQIWTFQKVTSDIFLNNTPNVTTGQWILSKEYTLGANGEVQPDNTINFYIDDFISPDENYTIAVRVFDENDQYVCEQKNTFTPTQLGIVKITKVLVDGKYSIGQEIKEIKSFASVSIDVIGNDAVGMTYTATILETKTNIPAGGSSDSFVWNISTLVPDDYTIEVVATNGVTTDKRIIHFKLYSMDPTIQYAVIDSMNITKDNGVAHQYNFEPSYTNGNLYYSISEPSKRILHKNSGTISPEQYISMGNKIGYTQDKFGVYDVAAYVKRPNAISYDDGIRKTLEIKRSETIPSTLNITATGPNESAINLANPIMKNTALKFSVDASIGGLNQGEQKEYSFFRHDANGYHLIKDWSTDNTLDWTPARIGEYYIEARAKGPNAGSYEVRSTVGVKIIDTVESIAKNIDISINEAELQANLAPRKPVLVVAQTNSANAEDLLYRFIITDEALDTTVLQAYSANQTFLWMPRKAGAYNILVEVKNEASFGVADSIKVFHVTVN